MNIPGEYELTGKETISELNAEGCLLRHRQSGAHILVIECDDPNKVFYIGFKTVPGDDTGAPHILEHTVLTGSEKYPVKDPMSELSGSLYTYLNAMTYPDRTVYPVASTNQKSFENLMAVYTDAVFHPLLLHDPRTFYQEGWHYEMEDVESELKINGIVYNEMRGAFSDKDQVLERYILKALFPDTSYAFESGGDPEHIPELDYETFKNFYRRYYHPSNAYIYLYGDCDMEERLRFLNDEYLKNYDAIDPKTDTGLQKPFEKMHDETIMCNADEDDENGYTFVYSKVVSGHGSMTDLMAWEILDSVLFYEAGAPVRQALLDAGIGEEITGGLDDSVRQPYFQIWAKGCRAEDKERFVSIIEETLRSLAENGISRKSLRAAVNSFEFSSREAEETYLPKGLDLGLDALGEWIHTESGIFDVFRYEKMFDELKKRIETGYFEQMIRDSILDNPFGAVVTEIPAPGLTETRDEALRKKLEDMKAAMTDEEKKAAVLKTEALKAYQEECDTEEALSTIPVLELDDIEKKISPFVSQERSVGTVPVIYQDFRTSGIIYTDLRFDISDLADEDLCLLMLVKNLLGVMDTDLRGYKDLNDEIGLKIGGLTFGISVLADAKDPDRLTEQFCIRMKFLDEQTENALALLEETLMKTDFSDIRRLRDILTEIRSMTEDGMISSGHRTALKKALSSFSTQAAIEEHLTGVSWFRYLESFLDLGDEEIGTVVPRMAELLKKIAVKRRLIVSATCTEEEYSELLGPLESFLEKLPEGENPGVPVTVRFPDEGRNEAITTPGQVQYNVMGTSIRKTGASYSGTYEVLRSWLANDYLWNNLRIKGGAYGCGSIFRRTGEAAFFSYRDPALKGTYDIYRALPGYLRHVSIDRRSLIKSIIGVISVTDTPLSPQAKGARSFTAWLTGTTGEEAQKERDQILTATGDDLKALADPIEKAIQNAVCTTVGSQNMIRKEGDMFELVTDLSGEKL